MNTVSLSFSRNFLFSFLLLASLWPSISSGVEQSCASFLKNKSPDFFQNVVQGNHTLSPDDFNEELTNELVAFWLNLLNSNQAQGHLFKHSPQAAFGPTAAKNLPYPAIKIFPANLPISLPTARQDYLTEFFHFLALARQHNVHLSPEVQTHLEDWGVKMMAFHLYQMKINFEIIFPPYRLPYIAIIPAGPQPYNRLAKILAEKSSGQIMLAFVPHLFLEEINNYAYRFYPTSQILNIGNGILHPWIKNYPLLAELRLMSYTSWQQNYQQVPGDTTLVVRQGSAAEQGTIPLKNVERFIYLTKSIVHTLLAKDLARPQNIPVVLKTLQSTLKFTSNVGAEIARIHKILDGGQTPTFSKAYPLAVSNLSQVAMYFPPEITTIEYEFNIPFAADHPLADDPFFLKMWAKQQLQLDHLFLTATINQLTILTNYLSSGQKVATSRFQRNMLRYTQRYLKTLRQTGLSKYPISQQQWAHYLHDIIEGP